MAITIIDKRTALVVIDLQNNITSRPTIHPISDVVYRTAELAIIFRRHNMAVVLVNVDGTASGRTEHGRGGQVLPPGSFDLLPELNRQPQDHIITKRTWSAFTNTDLEDYLRQHEITQIVLAGAVTSGGVESTARLAYELGFNVTLATDAMTDLSQEAHDNAIMRIFPRLGETGTTTEIARSIEKSHT